MFSNKTKFTFDTTEALKDFFVTLKCRFSWFELFCFIPPNYRMMNGQELKVCSLLNVCCSDSVADVALVGWQ